MPETTRSVQHVQHLCTYLCSIVRPCAACAASFPLSSCGRVRARSRKTTTTFRKLNVLHMLHMLHMPSKSTTYEKIDGAQVNAHAAHGQRTIRGTPENASQMQQVVKNWPELHALVKDLQAADLFPGLRGLQITLSGSPEYLAKGLGALLPPNTVKTD